MARVLRFNDHKKSVRRSCDCASGDGKTRTRNGATALHGELRKSLVACGCDNVLAERLAERTLKELAALVVTARSERERRLRLLPTEACSELGELTPIHRDGQVDEMWPQGIHIADGGSIRVRLTYEVSPRYPRSR